MAMQGNLQAMSVADLIQHACQDQKPAKLSIQNNGHTATMFFKDGAVQHAVTENAHGEEAVYELLNWQQGDFTLETGQEPPQVSIAKSWTGLLLEAARRFDEGNQHTEQSTQTNTLQGEKPMAKKKSEILADALADLLQGSSDIHGVAIVGMDGLVYSANVPQRALDEEMVGATSAAVLGLSRRSAGQLKRGNFKQTLIQGDDGNIIVCGLNDETLLVGLTPGNVNLGMAFAEMRTMTQELVKVL
jgi:predicted regulator of Ras-like GTPase activity (Roadblock/LC7/MglB family)